MTTKTNISAVKIQIRRVLEQWTEATRMGRREEILANHTSDVTIFDVLPPMQYKGAKAYRKSWDEWQPETVGLGVFEIQDLKITADQKVGFAYGFIRCGGTKPDGEKFEDFVRATFCLRKIADKWMVAHQHISMPVGESE
jgi:ketosteroid isomerase-like protein